MKLEKPEHRRERIDERSGDLEGCPVEQRGMLLSKLKDSSTYLKCEIIIMLENT
tara:strand:- start:397 stop:558 length:162 start_codon:yes stop_codon:yes gene_type:complete